MEDVRIILNLFIALGAAVAGGLIARRLGLPVLIGYVVAGIVIGPNSPGVVADTGQVTLLANLGVAFLMFALGVEFSIGHLLEVRRIAIVAASVQYPVTFALGALVGRAIGWDWAASLLLGGVFVISSSIVMIKLLINRGETTSWHARIAFGLGVIQDLSLVPLLAFVPVLSGESDHLVGSLAKSLGTAALALVLVFALGLKLVPFVLYRIARTGSRELFLLIIVVIAMGTAYASHEAGLSFALGAFLAGLVVSESEFATEVLAEIVPLRDLFSTLFFVSLGMLLRPELFLDHPVEIGLSLLALVVGKIAIAAAGFLVAGIEITSALLAALYLAQIGEFSFVLAGVGLDDDILDNDQYGIILTVALVSILISPLLPLLEPRLAPIVGRIPVVRRRETRDAVEDQDHAAFRRHVIIAGYGRVGQALGDALLRKGLRFVVVDLNPGIIRDLRTREIPAIYGDGATEAVLEKAGIGSARALAITIPDPIAARGMTARARKMSDTVDIVTRAGYHDNVDELVAVGANETVQPEFEAG
ncbi:MAG TPA: cation:proton antiporter, partial [Thermomicrobiales bacterium]|nr:cation:proton antiporter [Thermomicrobiales bacterium]